MNQTFLQEILISYHSSLLFKTLVLFIVLLLPSAWIDLKKRILPDTLTFAALGFLLIIRSSQGELINIETILLPAVGAGSFTIIALYYKDRMGWGDVKLSAVLALGLGYFPWMLMVFLSSFSGLVFLLIRYKGKPSKAVTLPLGTFMISTSIILLTVMYGISIGRELV